ncbi:MAG TPA: phosphomethylpyrimidine synthase, partial [Prosthecochloris aestuarii]|nr:phosphomethylpyrimidine synthase [Prosthecochloris aestuarii]
MTTSSDTLFSSEQNFYGTESRKIYIEGSLHPVRVGMRELSLSKTYTLQGQQFASLPLYDTSGPYSDPHAALDPQKG